MGMKYGAGMKNCTGMIHNHIASDRKEHGGS